MQLDPPPQLDAHGTPAPPPQPDPLTEPDPLMLPDPPGTGSDTR